MADGGETLSKTFSAAARSSAGAVMAAERPGVAN